MTEIFRLDRTIMAQELGADLYIPALQELLKPRNFNWNLVTEHGAIYFDVGHTPEALHFKRNHRN